ncbi:Dak kinase, partial [Ilyonectria destructans]
SLVTVMNYKGDILNFGVAVGKAKAEQRDLRIEMLMAADGVDVPCSKFGRVGRRGMASTFLLHKITVALAGLDYPLDVVLRVG